MLDLMKIGSYITKLRTDMNMSQQQLADNLFVTHQAVSKWETGKSIPNIEIMANITKLFSITIDQLLNAGDSCPNDNFIENLNTSKRSITLNQFIKGNYPEIKIEEVMYLLSMEEREFIVGHIINHNIVIDISEIFPYLNIIERKRVINAILSKKLNYDINYLYHTLSQNEKLYIKNSKGL